MKTTPPNATPPAAAPKPETPAARRKRLRRVAHKLQRHLRLRKNGALIFGTAGSLLDEALALGIKPGEDIPLPDGRVLRVHDQFAQGNQAGGYKVFERFKVEEVDPAKEARRARRGAATNGKEDSTHV